ncbi:Uncharacterised protein [uncultured archaeon]|nr:Uncharacterised protein [uncultured archaeon]
MGRKNISEKLDAMDTFTVTRFRNKLLRSIEKEPSRRGGIRALALKKAEENIEERNTLQKIGSITGINGKAITINRMENDHIQRVNVDVERALSFGAAIPATEKEMYSIFSQAVLLGKQKKEDAKQLLQVINLSLLAAKGCRESAYETHSAGIWNLISGVVMGVALPPIAELATGLNRIYGITAAFAIVAYQIIRREISVYRKRKELGAAIKMGQAAAEHLSGQISGKKAK